MVYGINVTSLFSFKPKSHILSAGGYKQMPNHVDSKLQVDEQWISNTTFSGSHFPRFHFIRDGAIWYVHYDKYKYNHNKIITDKNIIKPEITRLMFIERQYANQKNRERSNK